MKVARQPIRHLLPPLRQHVTSCTVPACPYSWWMFREPLVRSVWSLSHLSPSVPPHLTEWNSTLWLARLGARRCSHSPAAWHRWSLDTLQTAADEDGECRKPKVTALMCVAIDQTQQESMGDVITPAPLSPFHYADNKIRSLIGAAPAGALVISQMSFSDLLPHQAGKPHLSY